MVQAPASAEIHIDQQLAGHSTGGPLKIKVQPGQRTVDVFLPGYQPYSRTLSVSAGTQADLLASLSPIAAPSVPSSPPPPRAAIEVDRQGIKLALNRYRDAYQSESLDDMKKAWPDISKSQQKDLRETFKVNAIRLELNCQDEDIHIAGSDALVDCGQVITFTLNGIKQPPTASKAHIGLRKQGGSWTIASVR
jgi:hypothetical protein